MRLRRSRRSWSRLICACSRATAAARMSWSSRISVNYRWNTVLLNGWRESIESVLDATARQDRSDGATAECLHESREVCRAGRAAVAHPSDR